MVPSKWGVDFRLPDLLLFYATIKKCDTTDKWGLLDRVKLDLGRHMKIIFEGDCCRDYINERLENGKLSHALLLEIVSVALGEHSKAKIKGESHNFFVEHESGCSHSF